MISELLGYSLELFHAIFIILLWTTPFYLRNPRYIIYAIILQIAVLIQLYLLKNRCILTLIEKKLLNKDMASYKGKPISRFNEFLANTIGYDGMININLYTPYLAILGNLYNLYRFL
jgi:hypothetical protein